MLEKEEEEERQNPGLKREQEHQEAQRHQRPPLAAELGLLLRAGQPIRRLPPTLHVC